MLRDYITTCSYLVCTKHFCRSGSPKQILCLPVLNSFKNRNISCRSGLSFHFELTETETWASLAKFLGLPCWRWSNQSKWIRSKMSKCISIHLIAILQSCLRGKEKKSTFSSTESGHHNYKVFQVKHIQKAVWLMFHIQFYIPKKVYKSKACLD